VFEESLDFLGHFAPIRFSGSFAIGEWINLIPQQLATPGAELFERQVGFAMDTSGGTIKLYRNHGAMLSSIQNFWPGYAGHQTWVWVGVCDDIAVWTQSGPVTEDWLDKSGDVTNTHLPNITQTSNVALISYKPKPISKLLSDVALFWPAERFDEVRSVPEAEKGSWIAGLVDFFVGWIFERTSPGSWILGRKNRSYIAVYRPCGERTDKGWFACEGNVLQGKRQIWIAVSGEATTHGPFEDFATIIGAAVVEESTDRRDGAVVYKATVTVDGKTGSTEW